MITLNKSLEQDSKILFGIITEVTGITQEQINNGSRKRNITDARIGSVTGGLDHSSIIYYRSKLNDICDVDKEFKRKFTEINSRFKAIKICLPLTMKLNIAIEERDRLNKEIRIMKKKLRYE